jgi:hypothetical protein
MLGGIAPILIFTFPSILKVPGFNALSGIPIIGDEFINGLGVPIPIYLDERLTGIYIDREGKNIDIETNPLQTSDNRIVYTQRGLGSITTVNLLAKKDAILLSSLLAFFEMIFARVVSQEYQITYLNGVTTIFNGLLHGVSTDQGADDDLLRITLQISKGKLNSPTQTGEATQIPKGATGATPLG